MNTTVPVVCTNLKFFRCIVSGIKKKSCNNLLYCPSTLCLLNKFFLDAHCKHIKVYLYFYPLNQAIVESYTYIQGEFHGFKILRFL